MTSPCMKSSEGAFKGFRPTDGEPFGLLGGSLSAYWGGAFRPTDRGAFWPTDRGAFWPLVEFLLRDYTPR
jgi:hypothetical protein